MQNAGRMLQLLLTVDDQVFSSERITASGGAPRRPEIEGLDLDRFEACEAAKAGRCRDRNAVQLQVAERVGGRHIALIKVQVR